MSAEQGEQGYGKIDRETGGWFLIEQITFFHRKAVQGF